MDNKRMKNIVIGLGAFTLITLGLGKFFDTRCESTCIGEALAANTKDGWDGLIVFDDKDDRITIGKGNGPLIHISGNDSDDADNPARTDKSVSETVSIQGIKELQLASFVTDWKIVESADDKMHLVFKGYLPPKEWTVKNSGDRLEVEIGKKGPNQGELQIPKNFTGELSFTNVSGDITVENLGGTERFHLTSVSGDLHVKATGSKVLTLSTVSGDVDFQPASLNKDLEITYNSVSGDLQATLKTPVKAFDARSVSGDVNLSTGQTVGFDFEMEGISASFEGLPDDTRQAEGFGNRSARGTFGASPKGKLTFNSVSGDFNLKPLD